MAFRSPIARNYFDQRAPLPSNYAKDLRPEEWV